MSSNLLFDFTVDSENKTVCIQREFNTPLNLVWQAWTNPEILDQWCAPNPYKTETKTMDFRKGGFWHYAIVSPDGTKHWSRYDYKKIEPQKSITELRTFSDESGTFNPDFPATECTITFNEIPTDAGSKTHVTMIEKYGSPEMFEKMSSVSHKKGFSSHLKNLDKLLQALK